MRCETTHFDCVVQTLFERQITWRRKIGGKSLVIHIEMCRSLYMLTIFDVIDVLWIALDITSERVKSEKSICT